MPLLEGKKAFIFGVANHRSIAWAIAQALASEGAQLAFAYQERMEKYVRDLAEKIPGTAVIPCDVQQDDQLDSAFAQAGEFLAVSLIFSFTVSRSHLPANWKIRFWKQRVLASTPLWISALIRWLQWHVGQLRS